jgi:hypothetical protein
MPAFNADQLDFTAFAMRETVSRAERTRLLSNEDYVALIRAFENTEPNADLIDLMKLHNEISSSCLLRSDDVQPHQAVVQQLHAGQEQHEEADAVE